jgi:anti-sigma factor RsiW
MSMHLDEEALAALAFEEPIDAAQQAHLDGCAACQTRALEARAMVGDVSRALDVLEPEPELSRERQDAVFRQIEARVTRPSWDRLVLPAVILTLSLLLISVARERADLNTWVLVALLGAGLFGGLAHTPLAKFAALGALALSISLSVFDAEGLGALHMASMGKCLAAEVVVGAISAGVSVAWLKRSASPPSLASLAAALTAGALGAQGALLITCHEPHGLMHGLVSHTLGVAVAGALAWPLASRFAAKTA